MFRLVATIKFHLYCFCEGFGDKKPESGLRQRSNSLLRATDSQSTSRQLKPFMWIDAANPRREVHHCHDLNHPIVGFF